MYIYYSLVAVLFALSFCIGLMLSHNSIFCSQHHNQCKGTVVFSIHYFNIPLGFIRRLSNKSDVHVFVPNKIQATRKEMQEHNAFCDFANSVSISSQCFALRAIPLKIACEWMWEPTVCYWCICMQQLGAESRLSWAQSALNKMANNFVGHMYFRHPLPGGTTSWGSFAWGHQAPSSMDVWLCLGAVIPRGRQKALPHWLPMFVKKVIAHEKRHSGR